LPDALFLLLLLNSPFPQEAGGGAIPEPEISEVLEALLDEQGAVDLVEFLDGIDPPDLPGADYSLKLRSRIQEREPHVENALGSPVSAYSRLTLSTGSGLEAGGLWKRDAGEASRDALESAYCSLRNLLPSVNLLLGDFSLEAGQGLVLWRGKSLSKSAWAVAGPRKSGEGILPHRSTEEIRFFRGIAVTASLGDERNRWEGALFLSRRNLPGSLGDDGEVSAISETSAFTTESSASRKDAVRVDAYGGRLVYSRGGAFRAGLTFVRSRMGVTVRRDDPVRFNGNEIDVSGIDCRWTHGPLSLFAETAKAGKGVAAVGGAGVSAGKAFSALILYRAYAAGFDNLYASGFGDNGHTRNEEGIYAGVVLRPLPWLTLSAYTDQFRTPARATPWLGNEGGAESLLNADVAVSARVHCSARLTARSVAVPQTSADARGREAFAVSDRDLVRGRIMLTLLFAHGIELRPRAEFVRVPVPLSGIFHGFLGGTEIGYRPSRRLRITAQLLVFDAASYDARIPAFAADLPGTFSSQPLYGRGRRWSLALHVVPSSWCSLSAVIDAVEKEPSVSSDSRMLDTPASRQSHAGVQIDLSF
jgi:hypothetical protein